jgi:hypothetical protein
MLFLTKIYCLPDGNRKAGSADLAFHPLVTLFCKKAANLPFFAYQSTQFLYLIVKRFSLTWFAGNAIIPNCAGMPAAGKINAENPAFH